MPSAPTARAAFGAAVLGNRLYAAGGVDGRSELARLEIFDFRTRRWARGPDMAVAREHVAATSAGGAVYLLGGRRGGGLGGVALGRRVYAIQGGTAPGFSFSRAVEVLDVSSP